jgi:hypothetical protein
MNVGPHHRRALRTGGAALDVLEAVSEPDRVLAGQYGALMAVREMKTGKHLVVVYNEEKDDGFTIAAFSTRSVNWLSRRRQVSERSHRQ